MVDSGAMEPAEGPESGLRPRDVLVALTADLALPRERVCTLGDDLSAHPGEAVSTARLRELLSAHFRPPHTAVALEVAQEAGARAREVQSEAAELGARVVTRVDPDYPAPLLELERPPAVLWIRGPLRRRRRLAIVGPRHADRWALDAAVEISAAVSREGFPVVSGFAAGVDVAAHRAALGGPTIAVLGCGLKARYPRAHYRLADEIVTAGGTVLTELPAHAEPKAQNFPPRNRIIAALAHATLVVQATSRSGALITARYAADLGRTVLAVPGRPVDARSRGTNRLLRDGALVALGPADVLAALGLQLASGDDEAPATPPTASLRREILRSIAAADRSLDELARELSVPVAAVQAQLLELELDGLIRQEAGRAHASPSARRLLRETGAG